jgi:uncharacterized protein
MERYLDFVERHARKILALLVLVTIGFTVALGSLTSDTNPYLLKESHPARKSMIDMQAEFTGTYDSVMVSLYNPDSVFNQTTLDALFELSRSLRRINLGNEADLQMLRSIGEAHAGDARARQLIEAVTADGLSQNDYRDALALAAHAEAAGWPAQQRQFLRFLAERINPIREMASMADLENIVLGDDGTLIIHHSLNRAGNDPERVRREIMGNELMVGGVVSRDQRVALLVAELGVKQDDAEAQLRAYHAVQRIIDDYRQRHPAFTDEVFIAGMPIFIAAQEEVIEHDLGLLFPLVFVLITALLVAFFRRPLGVVLPLLNILFCTLWTLGLMAILDVPIDLLTSVLPVFLFTICSSDAIHFMAEYYEQKRQGRSNREANRATMRLMVPPIVLTTITTVAAFLISTLTNIVSIRNFGLFMSIGLIAALVISLLLIPAWLAIWGRDGVRAGAAAGESRLSRLLVAATAWLIARRRAARLLTLPLMATLLVLAWQVEIEDSGVAYFRADNPFRVSDEFINRHVAGTAPGWIVIDTDRPRGALEPDVVRFIDGLDQFLRAQPDVNYGYSLATYIRRMNLVLNDMDPEFDRVPADPAVVRVRAADGSFEEFPVAAADLIDQHVMLFENGGGSDLTNVLNDDYSKAVSLYTMTTSVASDYRSLLAAVDAWVADHAPPGVRVVHAGTQVIWTGVLAEITRGHALSFALALAAVTLMMIAWLRSWRLGLLGALPLAATAASLFACMFVFGIELNIGTVLVTYLVVGIVDYTAHLLLRVRLYVRQGQHVDAALLQAVRYVGRSIAVNVVVFSVGFMSLLFSDYKPIVDLGALVALALFISGLMTLVVIVLAAPWFFAPERAGAVASRQQDSNGREPMVTEAG